MRCCGQDGQVIELRGGEAPLRMVRCGTCSHREWRLGPETIAVEAAFEVLAQTYRALPRAARVARAAAATQTAARAAVRAAKAAPVQAPARDRGELAQLLQGWSVLGATG